MKMSLTTDEKLLSIYPWLVIDENPIVSGEQDIDAFFDILSNAIRKNSLVDLLVVINDADDLRVDRMVQRSFSFPGLSDLGWSVYPEIYGGTPHRTLSEPKLIDHMHLIIKAAARGIRQVVLTGSSLAMNCVQRYIQTGQIRANRVLIAYISTDEDLYLIPMQDDGYLGHIPGGQEQLVFLQSAVLQADLIR